MLMLVYLNGDDVIFSLLIKITPNGRKGFRFLFRNPAAEPLISRALAREFVGATQKDLETPSGDPERVFFSV